MDAFYHLPLLLPFIVIHVLAPRFRRVRTEPRSIWLSMAGGCSIGYVFVHGLPSVMRFELAFAGAGWHIFYPFYIMTLVGFTLYYLLETWINKRRTGDIPDRPDPAFWFHVSLFAFYNAVLSFLITGEEMTWVVRVLFTAALTFHLIVNDFGLRQKHGGLYDRYGRFLLIAGVLVGGTLGLIFAPDQLPAGLCLAFLVGGNILNTIKEELPQRRHARAWAFLVGVIFYGSVLVAAGIIRHLT